MTEGITTKGWLVVAAVSLGACQLIVATEQFAESSIQCFDGIDNDDDGLTDCADESCSEACGIDRIRCGNGIVDPGEECDPGPGSPECDDDCTFARCGDFFVNPYRGEQCDDGNQDSGDGCSAECFREDGENFCGDGIQQEGEQCDHGGDSPECDRDCTFASCGDSYINPVRGEQCDDGNQISGDGCSASCTLENEMAFCGDGIQQPGEECDTGGDSPGCDGDCTIAFCGDDYINPTRGEQCDDGNLDNGDGCDAMCRLEPGPGPGGNPAVCGDGILQSPEQCDDGNTVGGDGCSATCKVEP
jgi:cysteine-rich repeat protein